MDHGLYRVIDSQLQSNYAHLWDSVIHFDEKALQKYSKLLLTKDPYTPWEDPDKGMIHPHRLFASLLSGRSWETLSSPSSLASLRSRSEDSTVKHKLGTKVFLSAISNLLANVPRPVLLLLKTQDLLRAVDESLGVGTMGDEKGLRVVMRRVGRYVDDFYVYLLLIFFFLLL